MRLWLSSSEKSESLIWWTGENQNISNAAANISDPARRSRRLKFDSAAKGDTRALVLCSALNFVSQLSLHIKPQSTKHQGPICVIELFRSHASCSCCAS